MKKQIVLSLLISLLALTTYAQPPMQGKQGQKGQGKEIERVSELHKFAEKNRGLIRLL